MRQRKTDEIGMTGSEATRTTDSDILIIKPEVTGIRPVFIVQEKPQKKGTTMATIVKKKSLKYEAGYITYQGQIISPSWLCEFRSLDNYLVESAKRKEIEALEDQLDEVRRGQRNEAKQIIEVPAPETPALDAEVERQTEISEDLKAIDRTNEVNAILAHYDRVAAFVVSDTYVLSDDEYYNSGAFEPQVLGDPFKLTEEKLVELVKAAI
jgi:hypothetical protein